MCWSTEVIIIGAISRKTIKKLCSTILKAAILWWSTVFVRISAHPPHRHRGGSTRLFTYWLEWQWDWNWNWISTNKRLPRRRRFLQSILQKPCFVTSLRFVTTIYCLLQNIHTTLTENGENLVNAQPPISAQSQGQKNLITAQGG